MAGTPSTVQPLARRASTRPATPTRVTGTDSGSTVHAATTPRAPATAPATSWVVPSTTQSGRRRSACPAAAAPTASSSAVATTCRTLRSSCQGRQTTSTPSTSAAARRASSAPPTRHQPASTPATARTATNDAVLSVPGTQSPAPTPTASAHGAASGDDHGCSAPASTVTGCRATTSAAGAAATASTASAARAATRRSGPADDGWAEASWRTASATRPTPIGAPSRAQVSSRWTAASATASAADAPADGGPDGAGASAGDDRVQQAQHRPSCGEQRPLPRHPGPDHEHEQAGADGRQAPAQVRTAASARAPRAARGPADEPGTWRPPATRPASHESASGTSARSARWPPTSAGASGSSAAAVTPSERSRPSRATPAMTAAQTRAATAA